MTTPTYYTGISSPIGPLLLTSNEAALTGLFMGEHRHGPQVGDGWILRDDTPPFAEVTRQLNAYFDGTRTDFDLSRFALAPIGTEFQKQVWDALGEIPYATTISYGELARRIGNTNASRAVGLANGRNPLSIIVPCHRVIGANGKLIGYGGGMERKQTLLAWEASVRAGTPRPWAVLTQAAQKPLEI